MRVESNKNVNGINFHSKKQFSNSTQQCEESIGFTVFIFIEH